MLAVALAVGAALLFAAGTVLQERVAAAEPEDDALRPSFLVRLARRPVWIAGIACDALGFGCQAAALGVGKLVVVQPILATSVVFALPLGRLLAGRRTSRRELLAAAAVTGGLAAFLALSEPGGGRDDAAAGAWIVAGAACAGACALLVAAAARRGAAARAALLGVAAGILFALSAALTKAVVDRLGLGALGLVADWHLYALLVVGATSMLLSQASLQTGALGPAVATQMTFDPLTSLVLGTTLLQETIHEDAGGLVASLASLLVMVAGLVVLAGRAAVAGGGSTPAAPPASPSPGGGRRGRRS